MHQPSLWSGEDCIAVARSLEEISHEKETPSRQRLPVRLPVSLSVGPSPGCRLCNVFVGNCKVFLDQTLRYRQIQKHVGAHSQPGCLSLTGAGSLQREREASVSVRNIESKARQEDCQEYKT